MFASPGVKFCITNFIEPWGYGGQNRASWVQLINSDYRVHQYDTFTTNKYRYGLDNWYPYSGYPQGDSYMCADSPNIQLYDSTLSASADTQYTTWLMFEPSPMETGASSIPVPLEAINWKWSVCVTNMYPNSTNWNCSTNWNMLSVSNSVSSPVETVNYPEWSVNTASF